MSTELAVVEQLPVAAPSALMRQATDVAGLCKQIVVKTAVTIGKKKYVPVESWCTIAAAYGCTPSIREVSEEDGGIRAVCDLKRTDGTVIASAEGWVGGDEPTWASRPVYARRAMAQTRSISRVCRTAFAFIVTMMDAGLSTTPLEEVPHGGFDEDKTASPVRVINQPKPAPAAARPAAVGKPIPFGKNRGKQLSEIDDTDLKWLLDAAIKSVNANAKPEFLEANKAWLGQVEAEAARRVVG